MADQLVKQSGGKAIVFARLRSNQATQEGTRVAYQTTYSYKLSRDSKTEDTKDGKVTKGGALEGTLSLELLSSNQAIVRDLESAQVNAYPLDFWIVFTDTPGTKSGTYAGRYMIADLTSFEETGDSDNSVSVKIEASIQDGYARLGDVTLSVDQQDNGYDFKDLGKVSTSETTSTNTAPTPTK
ncbi:phage major tail protein, TP901-1 family [Fructobacillus evanidus]|uniref:Phage major tail protein, TP901-1 family n=1 Tax=Fructobacillus evanidus TaxID=3064281 RepID=A0ABM9MM73_9LACO|nr:hypothetical protein R55250_KEHBDPNM_00186 [Fructobacillus sp. LMG 32999]CAK1222248.1 hypothetical protein R53718_MFFEMHAI_00188 [Fructobacillus sp. LMG 32999]CAK1225595.1 hypothetical protein R54837_OMAIDLJD_00107 [Fructobacillus sp. LMG 32999]CAK1225804.1 hypothetical protein R53534_HOPDCFKK_00109 [Fructobacillus sp. LMG 32999]CAK1225956.1 hypothetical protein R55214_HHFBAMCI_00118 [Fructobacillus sp. LMG 32999]